MWLSFVLCCMALLAVLYVPGALASKAAGLSPFEVLVLAPLTSVALYAALGILLDASGLRGLGSLSMGAIACSLLFLALLLIRRYQNKRQASRARVDRGVVVELAVSVCVCSVAMAYLYVKALGGADSFLECSDNAFHLNQIKAMLDGGSLSLLHAGQYSAMSYAAQAPFSISGSFYPAGWHILVALACSLTGAPATVGENAGAFVFAGIVFSSGMALLLKSVFPSKRGVAAVGSFALCSCAAFPLSPLVVHQIYPNFAALCALPGLMAFIVMRMDEACGKTDLAKTVALLLVPLFGCAALHPNVVIALLVMSVSMLVLYPWGRLSRSSKPGFVHRISIPFAIVVVFICGWAVSIDTPIFSGVTSYLWSWTIPPVDAFVRALSFGFVLGIPQLVFAVFVALGFLVCAKERRSRWVCLSLIAFLVIFFFNACGTPEVKKIFAGYWYTDAERTAALVALAAIPCAAVGLFTLLDYSWRKTSVVVAKKGSTPLLQYAMSCAIVVCFCVVAYMPYFPFSGSPTAIGFRRIELHDGSVAGQRTVFTEEEKEFCDKARVIAGDDLVLNVPQDGSMFSYSVCGLNVYYKSFVSSEDSSDSQLIRTQLSSYENNDAVRKAVAAAGARFVIVLDKGDPERVDFHLWGDYNDYGWEGFRGLDGNSSFRLVLEDGTRRLYEIV